VCAYGKQALAYTNCKPNKLQLISTKVYQQKKRIKKDTLFIDDVKIPKQRN
jgi:hypothetical protein